MQNTREQNFHFPYIGRNKESKKKIWTLYNNNTKLASVLDMSWKDKGKAAPTIR